MIKSVLVTGGAGYVGAVLVPKLLANDYHVTVVDWYLYNPLVFKDIKNKNLKEIKADIRNKKLMSDLLKSVDSVIHLACISNDPSYELNPELGKSVNYNATRDLFDLCHENKVQRVIFASSSSVYGVKKETNVTEDLPLEPLTDYSKYKALCEPYLLSKKSENFTPLVIRPATVCGYSGRMRIDLTVNMLTLQALVNKKITVFGGSQKRPNIHIKDIADLYVKCLSYGKEKISGKIFNAGYENYSVIEIAQMVKQVLRDKSIEIVTEPTNDLRSYHISSVKIKKELSYIPKHSVEDAINDIKKAYKNGLLQNPFTDPKYWNVKTMKSCDPARIGAS